jgi:MFS family permease
MTTRAGSAGPDPRSLPDNTHIALPASDDTGRQLRAPWAASIAGLLFAAMFTAAMLLLRNQPMLGASDADLAQQFATGQDLAGVVGGLYLAPFAGIMFLWFIAVIRDQIGEREDRFFATVFFGSGLLFVATMFVAIAVASTPVVGVRYLGQAAPSAREVELVRALAYTLMFGFGTRAAAVFLIAMATVGLKSGILPRWFGRTGYVLGILLLVVVAFWDWVILVLPAWVALVSLYILRRERSRRRAETAPTGAGA